MNLLRFFARTKKKNCALVSTTLRVTVSVSVLRGSHTSRRLKVESIQLAVCCASCHLFSVNFIWPSRLLSITTSRSGSTVSAQVLCLFVRISCIYGINTRFSIQHHVRTLCALTVFLAKATCRPKSVQEGLSAAILSSWTFSFHILPAFHRGLSVVSALPLRGRFITQWVQWHIMDHCSGLMW